MTDQEILQAMASMIQPIADDISELKTDVAELKVEMAEVKADVAELKVEMAEMKTDVAGLKETVTLNYEKTLEFYGMQKEFNTGLSDMVSEILARQIIYEGQTVRNTAMLTYINR